MLNIFNGLNNFNDDNLIDVEATFAWLNGESQHWTVPDGI